MLFIIFHVMPRVQMHIDNAEGLVTAYGAASNNARETMVALSPLVTRAYDLLGMAGQNGLTGPMPALMNLANDLRTEGGDVAWRVDWLKSTDALPLGLSGRVQGEVPVDLDAAFRASGLTAEQIELANEMMRDGVSFADAVAAAQSDDPQAALEAMRLAELNDAIENWNGTDNDPILDQLLRERRELLEQLAERDPTALDVDPEIWALAAQYGVPYGEAMYAVTVNNIDALTDLIDNWSGTDNDERLDELIRLRDEQIAILTEGDPELAIMFRSSLFDGMDANEASMALVEYIDHETRIDAIIEEQGVTRLQAETLLAEIEAEFEALLNQGLEGAELETAAMVLYTATMEGYDFDKINDVAQTEGIDHAEALNIVTNAARYGFTPAEFIAMQGFQQHFEAFDARPRTGGVYGVTNTHSNGKVNIEDLEFVVANPYMFSSQQVTAAQNLLDQPQLLNRIDTASHADLFDNDQFFGSTTADDGTFSLADLNAFDNGQFAFAQLQQFENQIDIAHQGGAIDGHLSKSDYEAFLRNPPRELTAVETQALEIVINGDLFDQTWLEENKNSLAIAAAIVTVTVATGGLGTGVVVGGLLGAAAAGGTTLAINTTSDDLDWSDDLAGNTINGALAGVGAASLGGSVSLLRTGATGGQRLLGATEVTAEITGALALGVADPVLRPVIGQENLDGFKTGTGAVATVTGIGALGANAGRWVRNRHLAAEGVGGDYPGVVQVNRNGTADFVSDNGAAFPDVHRSPHDGAPFVHGLNDPQVVAGLEDPRIIPREVPNPSTIQIDVAIERGVDPRWVDVDGELRWVDHPGTDGAEVVRQLTPGTSIDRFGNENPYGGFFSDAGEPLEGRALPGRPEIGGDYIRHEFDVVAPHSLPVHEGVVKPWFDDPGGLTQYRFDVDLVIKQYGPDGATPSPDFDQMIDAKGHINFEYWFGFTYGN